MLFNNAHPAAISPLRIGSARGGLGWRDMKTNGYAARSAKEPLAPWSFERRATGPRDVAIDILFCGVCHSDLHTVRSEWPGTVYPCVPGHEIVGPGRSRSARR